MSDEPTQGPRGERVRASGKLSERPSTKGPGSGRIAVGAVFAGRYEVQDTLGEGACGTVYAARRLDDGLQVALKVIHPHLASHAQVSKRFLREAAILGQLDGANIARIHDSGQDAQGLLFMALEHVQGEALSEVMAADVELPVTAVVDIILAVCEALVAAHAAGIVHRDLKPDNVMVKLAGSRVESVRVLDFGLSKMLHGHLGSTNLTEQNMVLGTPEYMAPEQARGEDIDGRSDLYSAGVMLYELLAGRRPFEGRMPMAVLTAQLTEPPPALTTRRSGALIPPSLAAVAMHALAKKRSERYSDVASMADAIRQAVRTPHDVESVRPAPAQRESLPFRDTDRFSVVHADTLRAARAEVTRTASQPGGRVPAWLVVSLSAAAIGVLVGILVALRC